MEEWMMVSDAGYASQQAAAATAPQPEHSEAAPPQTEPATNQTTGCMDASDDVQCGAHAPTSAARLQQVDCIVIDISRSMKARSGIDPVMTREDLSKMVFHTMVDSFLCLELEHAIGFSSGNGGNLTYYNKKNQYMYTAGGSIVIGDFNDPHDQTFLSGHRDNVTCLALSPSGEMIASGEGGVTADVVVWDVLRKRAHYRFEEHDHGVECLAFSHDERLLITCGTALDNKLIIWDLATGKINATFKMRKLSIKATAFGGMFRNVKRRDTHCYQFATCGSQNVTVWKLDPFEGSLEPFEAKQGRDFTTLAFTSDYETLYAGSRSGDITRLKVKNVSIECSVLVTKNGVRALTCGVGPDGSQIVCVCGGDGMFSVWKIEEDYRGKLMNQTIQEVQLYGSVLAVSLLRGGAGHTEALVGTGAGFVHRISLTNPSAKPLLVSENHHGSVNGVAYYSGVSDQFATCGSDCTVRIWDASNYGVVLKSHIKGAGRPNCIGFSLDTLFTGWSDGKLRCHHCEDGEFLWKIDDAHAQKYGGVTDLVQSHNEKFLLSSGGEGAVRIWEIKTKELITHLKEHKGPVNNLELFNDDAHALSCGRDRSIRSWDLIQEKRVTCHTQRMGAVNSVALSRDEKVVFTVGQERMLTVWDLRKQNFVAQVHTLRLLDRHRHSTTRSRVSGRARARWRGQKYCRGQHDGQCAGHGWH